MTTHPKRIHKSIRYKFVKGFLIILRVFKNIFERFQLSGDNFFSFYINSTSPSPFVPTFAANMIAIDNKLVSDEIIEEQFVCDLNKCKGGCCVDGDAGAPLNMDELDHLNEVYDAVLPYLPEESKMELQKQGRYVYDKEFGWVTPTIASKVCVYGITDKNGIVKCGIEQAYNDGKVQWKKPISCHLFPVRIKLSKNEQTEYVNYEPREDLCKAACSLGKKLKVPVYVFLKDALTRKYGTEFYKALEAAAKYKSSANAKK